MIFHSINDPFWGTLAMGLFIAIGIILEMHGCPMIHHPFPFISISIVPLFNVPPNEPIGFSSKSNRFVHYTHYDNSLLTTSILRVPWAPSLPRRPRFPAKMWHLGGELMDGVLRGCSFPLFQWRYSRRCPV